MASRSGSGTRQRLGLELNLDYTNWVGSRPEVVKINVKTEASLPEMNALANSGLQIDVCVVSYDQDRQS